MKILKGPIALATIRTSCVLGLRLVVQAGTLFLLAAVLGPEGFGLYAGLGAMAVLMGGLANFGTHLTLLRDVSRASTKVNAALCLALGTTAFCGLVLLVIYVVLAQALFQLPSDMFGVVLGLGAAEILFQPFLLLAAMGLHGQGRIARSQILLISPLCLRLVVVLFVAWAAANDALRSYVLGHLVAVILPLCYVMWRAPSVWRQPSRWRVARRSEWGDLAGYAVTNVSANGVAELDKMLAARLLPLGSAGVYSAASRMVGSLVLPVIAMILSAMPRLFRDGIEARRVLQRWLFVLAGIYGAFAAVVITVLAPLIELLLGEAYAGVSEFIYLLAFAIPALSVRAAATNVLTTLERPWLRICLELIGWLLIVGLALIFVQARGNHGLAVAVVCTEWLLALGSVITIRMISSSSHKSA